MNPEEASYKKIVEQFYSIVPNEKVIDILIDSFSSQSKEFIKSEIADFSPEEVETEIFLHHTIINFFNQINSINKQSRLLRLSNK